MKLHEIPIDREPFPVFLALEYATLYDEKTYQHAMRVAKYVAQNGCIPEIHKNTCVSLAIMHDLFEDTKLQPRDIPDNYLNFRNALIRLTKDKNKSYKEYCQELASNKVSSVEALCAYWVKIADMKDHLNLKDTLTDKLKAKYLEGLAELL